ncbi:MAG: hypothetical protein QOF89_5858 [Acidobacteriota bacterium]|jgi:hypothetical protein|nr:hypothetical protein [Acidobacteriota bacterium]
MAYEGQQKGREAEALREAIKEVKEARQQAQVGDLQKRLDRVSALLSEVQI